MHVGDYHNVYWISKDKDVMVASLGHIKTNRMQLLVYLEYYLQHDKNARHPSDWYAIDTHLR